MTFCIFSLFFLVMHSVISDFKCYKNYCYSSLWIALCYFLVAQCNRSANFNQNRSLINPNIWRTPVWVCRVFNLVCIYSMCGIFFTHQMQIPTFFSGPPIIFAPFDTLYFTAYLSLLCLIKTTLCNGVVAKIPSGCCWETLRILSTSPWNINPTGALDMKQFVLWNNALLDLY